VNEDMTMAEAAAALVLVAEAQGLTSAKLCLQTKTGLLWTVRIEAQAVSSGDKINGDN